VTLTVKQDDPRELIAEGYRIDGISAPECRAVFFDWALGVPADAEMQVVAARLLAHYGPLYPEHPMTEILQQATVATAKPRRRGGHRKV